MSLTPRHSENIQGRRDALKKMGKAGAFVLPAIATFKLSELSVRASGCGNTGSIDSAWDIYWSKHRSFLLRSKRYWSYRRQRWESIWNLLNKIF